MAGYFMHDTLFCVGVRKNISGVQTALFQLHPYNGGSAEKLLDESFLTLLKASRAIRGARSRNITGLPCSEQTLT